MSEGVFEIYRGGKIVASFPNEAGVRAYLEAEQEIWRPFLDEVADNQLFSELRTQNGTVVPSDGFRTVFDALIASLQSTGGFRDALGAMLGGLYLSRHFRPLLRDA